MSSNEEHRNKGISLRTLYGWLIVVAILSSGVMIYSTFRLSMAFQRLSKATDEYIYLE